MKKRALLIMVLSMALVLLMAACGKTSSEVSQAEQTPEITVSGDELGIYTHTLSDGSVSVVDAKGKPVTGVKADENGNIVNEEGVIVLTPDRINEFVNVESLIFTSAPDAVQLDTDTATNSLIQKTLTMEVEIYPANATCRDVYLISSASRTALFTASGSTTLTLTVGEDGKGKFEMTFCGNSTDNLIITARPAEEDGQTTIKQIAVSTDGLLKPVEATPEVETTPEPQYTEAPTVITQPQAVTATEGGNASFIARANNTETISWFISNGSVTYECDRATNAFYYAKFIGSHSDTLVVEGLAGELNGWCVYAAFTNNSGTTYSQTAKITVNAVQPDPSEFDGITSNVVGELPEAHTHEWRFVQFVDPTADAMGYTEYQCYCGEVLKTDWLPAITDPGEGTTPEN